jgi:branched-chain amino acid transport system substrate-binding protein
MRSTSVKAILALLVLALALMVGCGDSDDSSESPSAGLPKEIVIGAAIAKTGYLAAWDASIVAVEQLVDETNARGGIDGHKLRVIQADTRSEPQQAVVAVQKVIEEGADVLFMTGEALTASAGSPIAEEAGKLNFAIVNEPGYGPPTTGRLSFSSYRSLVSEASAGATFLDNRGIKKPFLFRDTALIYGKADCSAFQQAWERLGGSIAGSTDFKNSDESIASQVNEMERSEADAVVMCSYPPGGASAIKQIRASGSKLPILAAGAFDGTYWLKGISNTEEIYVPLMGSTYDPPDRPTAKLFKKLENNGVETDVSSVLLAFYTGGQLMLQAIEETGTVEGDVLADALEAGPHQTIIGQIEYSADDHHINNGAWPMYVFSDGKPKLVTKITPQFIPEYGE